MEVHRSIGWRLVFSIMWHDHWATDQYQIFLIRCQSNLDTTPLPGLLGTQVHFERNILFTILTVFMRTCFKFRSAPERFFFFFVISESFWSPAACLRASPPPHHISSSQQQVRSQMGRATKDLLFLCFLFFLSRNMFFLSSWLDYECFIMDIRAIFSQRGDLFVFYCELCRSQT